MYNLEFKKQFIDERYNSATSKSLAMNVLRAAGVFEDKWGADFCTVGEDMLKDMVEHIIGSKTSSRWVYMNTLRGYAKWVRAHNLFEVSDAVFEIEVVGVQKVREQTVSGPLHLQSVLDSIYNPVSQKTIDNTHRCFFWLAFAGMKECDIPYIRTKDVDFSLMCVKYNDKVYPLYREALPVINSCIEDESFLYIHPNYTIQEDIWKNRISGDTLMRGIKSSSQDIINLRGAISKKVNTAFDLNRVDVKISYNRVFNSGLFYRMYERERMGMVPNFMDAARDYTDGKTYQLASGRNTFESKVRRVARNYLSDYERWKLAYFI